MLSGLGRADLESTMASLGLDPSSTDPHANGVRPPLSPLPPPPCSQHPARSLTVPHARGTHLWAVGRRARVLTSYRAACWAGPSPTATSRMMPHGGHAQVSFEEFATFLAGQPECFTDWFDAATYAHHENNVDRSARGGESKRPVVESPWSQFTSECQRF
jgi:hypothetical protein